MQNLSQPFPKPAHTSDDNTNTQNANSRLKRRKSCLQEWDQITAMATAAYNYFPNMSAKESAFFLMYGRDPVNKLSSILNAPRRYLCDDSGLPDLEALKNMYQMVAQQLYNSRQCYIKENSTTRYLTMVS